MKKFIVMSTLLVALGVAMQGNAMFKRIGKQVKKISGQVENAASKIVNLHDEQKRHIQALQAAIVKNETDKNALKSEYENKISNLAVQHATELADLNSKFVTAVDQLKNCENREQLLQNKLTSALALQQKHNEEARALFEQKQQEWQKLMMTHRADMEKVFSDHSAALSSIAAS